MDISNVDLRHLRYFIAVAEELNFSRAALRLNMSQPPLSQQIQVLEERLGTQLFTRTKRSVALTDAGTWLLPAAKRLIEETRTALQHTQAAGRGETGELRIGSNFSSPFNPRFGKIITAFRKKHPHVRLVFRDALFDQVITGLQHNTLDLGFTWPSKLTPLGPVHFHVVENNPLRLCVPRRHKLATKKRIAITDLKNEILLLSARQTQTELFLHLQNEAHKAGFFLGTSLETVHFPLIVNLVAAGYGLALLPEFMSALAPHDVIFKPLPFARPALCQLPFVLAYNREKTGLLVKNFLDIA